MASIQEIIVFFSFVGLMLSGKYKMRTNSIYSIQQEEKVESKQEYGKEKKKKKKIGRNDKMNFRYIRMNGKK